MSEKSSRPALEDSGAERPSSDPAETAGAAAARGANGFSPDFRRQVLEDHRASGLSVAQSAARAGVSPSTLRRWLRQSAESSAVEFTIGMGDEVESSALKAIATATGGASYVAHDPTDIQSVFVTALFERKCRPACA